MLHKYDGLALHFSRDRRRMLIARADVHSRQAVLTNRGSDAVKTVLVTNKTWLLKNDSNGLQTNDLL